MSNISSVLFGFGMIILIIIIGVLIRSAIVFVVWNYMIVGAWGATQITFTQALTVFTLAMALTFKNATKVKQDD